MTVEEVSDHESPISLNHATDRRSDSSDSESDTRVRRSYSDVVAARAPEARSDGSNTPRGNSENNPTPSGDFFEGSLSSLTTEEKDNEGEWREVSYRGRSLSPKNRPSSLSEGRSGPGTTTDTSDVVVNSDIEFSDEQLSAIHEAELQLTPEELRIIAEREKKLNMPQAVPPHVPKPAKKANVPVNKPRIAAGPSKDKGKAVDPRNWGNAGLDDKDLIGEQRGKRVSDRGRSKKRRTQKQPNHGT